MNTRPTSTALNGFIGVFLACFLVATVPACAETSQGSEGFENFTAELWGNVNEDLDATVSLLDREDKLPKKSELPFYDYVSETKESNLRKINAVLDDAIAALEISGLNQNRVDISKWRSQIEESRRQIDSYRRKRVSARSEPLFGFSSIPGFRTKDTFEKYIETEEEKIEHAEKEIAKLKKECAAQLRESGLKISDEAVNGLFETVTGDDIISMANIFQNVKLLTVQLEKLAVESREDVVASKRYYGMYVALLRVLDRMQKKFIDDVDNVYVVRLEEFKDEATTIIDEAEQLIEAGSPQRSILESNIASNQRTHEAADHYIRYLQKQRALVAKENERLARNLATATNTYKTVKLSSDVIDLLRSSQESFAALMGLEVPALVGFEDEAMRQELQRMTQRMKELE